MKRSTGIDLARTARVTRHAVEKFMLWKGARSGVAADKRIRYLLSKGRHVRAPESILAANPRNRCARYLHHRGWIMVLMGTIKKSVVVTVYVVRPGSPWARAVEEAE